MSGDRLKGVRFVLALSAGLAVLQIGQLFFGGSEPEQVIVPCGGPAGYSDVQRPK